MGIRSRLRSLFGRSSGRDLVESAPVGEVLQGSSAEAFSFGDAVPVMEMSGFMDYLQCLPMGKWYEPPVSWDGLARTMRAGVHHSSAIVCKRNILEATFIPHKLLSGADFSRFCYEFLIFGNAYLERKNNRLGDVLRLEAPLSKYVRRGLDLSSFWYIANQMGAMGLVSEDSYQFGQDSIFHLMEADVNQDIYGLPDWLAALNSIFLNEAATLFRLKYYLNGSHAGYVFYVSDTAMDGADIESIKNSLKQSRGRGNFKNLFLYCPGGKKDGVQIIPLSEAMAKDEFFSIKSVSSQDEMAAHRIPPQLMGIVPQNAGGFSDAEKAALIFAANEIGPIQRKLERVNEWVGEEVIRFRPYALPSTPAPTPIR